MNKFLAIGLGAAAVVVALFVGSQLFGSPTGGLGADPTATATASAGADARTDSVAAAEADPPRGPVRRR